jgi:hypothetical protein
MINEDDQHEWQFRSVARFNGQWMVFPSITAIYKYVDATDCISTEILIQRRRKRDHLDPTPCEGIEHPVWRDWEASSDAEIQAVLVRKGMPFRSLEK